MDTAILANASTFIDDDNAVVCNAQAWSEYVKWDGKAKLDTK